MGQGWRLVPAVFEGLGGYKNGVNCIVATQVSAWCCEIMLAGTAACTQAVQCGANMHCCRHLCCCVQVGTVQFHNVTCADSGAGAKMLPVRTGSPAPAVASRHRRLACAPPVPSLVTWPRMLRVDKVCCCTATALHAPQINGKDSGSHYEIIWELDTRPRTTTPLGAMAGVFDALAVAQTQEGLRGSLVPWPSDRRACCRAMPAACVARS